MSRVLVAFVILVGLILLNAPIYSAILAAAVYITFVINHMPLQGMFTTVFESLTKNSLLAIPYFILAGNIMSGGTLGKRLIDSFSVFLGNVRAGMPIACMVSNAVFGAISGSPPAATAVFSKIVHKPIAESDGENIATGVIVSAAGLASIIPPSISMIIFGISTDTSISRLFIAGVIPGLLITVIICIYLAFVCKKNRGEKFSWKEALHTLKKGLPALSLPFLVLGGIYKGFLTPTEAGAFSAFYCFILSAFVFRELDLRKIFHIIKGSSLIASKTFLLIAASSFLGKALTISQFPQMLVSALDGISKAMFLLMLNLLLLFVGSFFDTAPAILILAPMFLPLATVLGVDKIHLGIIFVVNLTIGMFTPPFGLNIFVAQSVLKKSMGEISKSLIPFICLYIIALLLITYIPALSTILLSII
jgi:C4-dicarboxylate transporter DctM subunit